MKKAVSLGLLFFFFSFPALADKDNANILLGESPDFDTMPAFQRVLQTEPGTVEHERARINYLLDRVAASPYEFIRNNSTYSSKRAAMHLRWKLLRYPRLATNAEQFVLEVASSSRMSGKEYLMRKDDWTYPLRGIFWEELRLLDEALKVKKQTPLADKQYAHETP